MSELIQNAVYIKDADLFVKSEQVHDFVTYVWPDKSELSIDGGLEYTRRVGDLGLLVSEDRYEEYCLAADEPFEGYITDRLLWGSRGKDGTEPLTYRTIKEYAHRPDGIAHLQAILANCLNIAPMHKRVVEYWLDKQERARAV